MHTQPHGYEAHIIIFSSLVSQMVLSDKLNDHLLTALLITSPSPDKASVLPSSQRLSYIPSN